MDAVRAFFYRPVLSWNSHQLQDNKNDQVLSFIEKIVLLRVYFFFLTVSGKITAEKGGGLFSPDPVFVEPNINLKNKDNTDNNYIFVDTRIYK